MGNLEENIKKTSKNIDISQFKLQENDKFKPHHFYKIIDGETNK